VIVTSRILASVPRVRFGLSTRHGGVSPEPYGMNLSFAVGDDEHRVKENRERFFESLGIDQESVAIPGQVHSGRVMKVETPGRYPECDGLVTDRPGVYCCVSGADCIPVFLVDPLHPAVGAVHAGWRGTVAGIAKSAVELMQKTFASQPENLLAYIGPGADVCCYEVGAEVAERFPQGTVLVREGKRFVDLKKANREQLVGAGLPEGNIEVSPSCTISDSLYHSYRRDGKKSGRMMGVIGLLEGV
jgi:YfiH family protein